MEREHLAKIHLSDGVLIDAIGYEIWSGTERVAIEPKPLELLVYLVRHRRRVISKAELLDVLWQDCKVSEMSLSRAVYVARNALRACASPSGGIRNVRGRGYQFVPAVAQRSADSSYGDLEGRLQMMASAIERIRVELHETHAAIAALRASTPG